MHLVKSRHLNGRCVESAHIGAVWLRSTLVKTRGTRSGDAVGEETSTRVMPICVLTTVEVSARTLVLSDSDIKLLWVSAVVASCVASR